MGYKEVVVPDTFGASVFHGPKGTISLPAAILPGGADTYTPSGGARRQLTGVFGMDAAPVHPSARLPFDLSPDTKLRVGMGNTADDFYASISEPTADPIKQIVNNIWFRQFQQKQREANANAGAWITQTQATHSGNFVTNQALPYIADHPWVLAAALPASGAILPFTAPFVGPLSAGLAGIPDRPVPMSAEQAYEALMASDGARRGEQDELSILLRELHTRRQQEAVLAAQAAARAQRQDDIKLEQLRLARANTPDPNLSLLANFLNPVTIFGRNQPGENLVKGLGRMGDNSPAWDDISLKQDEVAYAARQGDLLEASRLLDFTQQLIDQTAARSQFGPGEEALARQRQSDLGQRLHGSQVDARQQGSTRRATEIESKIGRLEWMSQNPNAANVSQSDILDFWRSVHAEVIASRDDGSLTLDDATALLERLRQVGLQIDDRTGRESHQAAVETVELSRVAKTLDQLNPFSTSFSATNDPQSGRQATTKGAIPTASDIVDWWQKKKEEVDSLLSCDTLPTPLDWICANKGTVAVVLGLGAAYVYRKPIMGVVSRVRRLGRSGRSQPHYPVGPRSFSFSNATRPR